MGDYIFVISRLVKINSINTGKNRYLYAVYHLINDVGLCIKIYDYERNS